MIAASIDVRWDIHPFRKVPIESLKTIDSTLIVPIQTPTGIDDQRYLGRDGT